MGHKFNPVEFLRHEINKLEVEDLIIIRDFTQKKIIEIEKSRNKEVK